MDDRQLAAQIAWSFHGMAYVWGGSDPIAGFDCSGMNVEIYKSVGRLPRKGDWSADGLYHYFEPQRVDTPRLGCMVFFKKPYAHKIHHVEFCLNSHLSIGSSGGGSTTGRPPKEPEEGASQTDWLEWRLDRILWILGDSGARQDAYIKVRPFGTRTDL